MPTSFTVPSFGKKSYANESSNGFDNPIMFVNVSIYFHVNTSMFC